MIRRYLENLDWILLLTGFLLAGCGVVTIYSVTCDDPGMADYKKQILWIAISMIVFLPAIRIDYRKILRYSLLLYISTTLLLIVVLVLPGELGVHRWIRIGGFRLQPSELAKITLILYLAHWMGKWHGKIPRMKDFIPPIIITAIPFLLMLIEPDLGTSLVVAPIFAGLVFASGFDLKKIIIIALVVIVSGIEAAPHVLKPYQMKRITSFLHPEDDPLGSGYHLIQSEIAIGSGGFFGKGFKLGTQSHLNFLPVQDTDFIFSVWGEERGFAGSIFLLALYFLFLYRALRVARSALDMQGKFLCVGIAILFFTQIVINVGMVIGLMPITGLPLPFMSYGGSACVSNFFLFGLLLNVSMRKFENYSE